MIHEEMERYPPHQLDNYNRNHFRQNGNIDEHSFFSHLFNSRPRRICFLCRAGYRRKLISLASLPAFTADISRTNSAEKT